jgi:L-threonylcarbamoyladenylate synthase
MNSFDDEVKLAVDALKKGQVILYPTDTIWGLGCDATSTKAVSRLYKIKQRQENKSLIALLDDAEKISDYVKEVPAIAYDLLRSASNPITIVYPGARNLARNMIAPDGSVAIRISTNPFCAAAVKAFGKPIASSSANISGEPTAITYSQISERIKNAVDHIVKLYQDEVSHPKASTIVKLGMNGDFTIIRP